jgi:glucose/arabinose dehydrogenase
MIRRLPIRIFSLIAACTLPFTAVLGQRDIPFSGSYPTAPTGLENIPLGEGPWVYPTAEGMDIKVSIVAKIEYPMALEFLPDGNLLVITRRGEMYLIQDGHLEPTPIPGGPPSVFSGESGQGGTSHGYIDLVKHPDFANNQLLYLSYTKPKSGGTSNIAIGRARWTGSSLENFTDIFDPGPGIAGAGRLAFGQDGKLYVTTSGGDPQSLSSLGGKVLRLNDDGSVPADNPFSGRSDAKGEIYSYGHRGALGLAIHPETGAVFQNENGPNGGDEINLIKPGFNYGWPIVSLGRTYPGPWQTNDRPTHDIFEPPLVYWMPAIAVSGMLFYTGDALPAWKGDIIVGALRTGEVPGTGHLERVMINRDYQEMRRESLITNLHQRVRDVEMGPDEFLYLATEQRDGAILKIEPAK